MAKIEDKIEFYKEIINFCKRLIELERKANKALENRKSKPPGSSRASITTSNARWMIYTESKERQEQEFRTFLSDNNYPF